MPVVLVVPLEKHAGVGILLHSPKLDVDFGGFTGSEGACYEWASAGSDNGDDDCVVRARGCFVVILPVGQSSFDGFFVAVVFDGIFLEDFVGNALEVVCEWLERRL